MSFPLKAVTALIEGADSRWKTLVDLSKAFGMDEPREPIGDDFVPFTGKAPVSLALNNLMMAWWAGGGPWHHAATWAVFSSKSCVVLASIFRSLRHQFTLNGKRNPP